MQVRFYLDARTGLPDIYGHNVTEAEVEQVLSEPGEDRPGTEGARIQWARPRPAATCGASTSLTWSLGPVAP